MPKHTSSMCPRAPRCWLTPTRKACRRTSFKWLRMKPESRGIQMKTRRASYIVVRAHSAVLFTLPNNLNARKLTLAILDMR